MGARAASLGPDAVDALETWLSGVLRRVVREELNALTGELREQLRSVSTTTAAITPAAPASLMDALIQRGREQKIAQPAARQARPNQYHDDDDDDQVGLQVDVVGLKPEKAQAVQESSIGSHPLLHLRFVGANENVGVWRKNVVVTKYTPRAMENAAKAAGSKLYLAQGSTESVIQQLRQILEDSRIPV